VYDSHYGYSEIPFRLSPDPSFYFGSKGHNRALAYLRYGLTQKEGFIVVTGTPGTGKTTIARTLLQEVGSERIVVSELNTTHLQADDVLRMVAASYGLEHENTSKASLLKRLEQFFLAKFRAGYHCLLMIDEAQNLPFESIEELRMLSNFYQGNNALVQIFLLGQEQFRDMLYMPKYEQLRQRVVAATHLEPLSARDTRDYIMHRLTRVGWTGENPAFTKRAFAHIYALTQGIPRRVNTFCDRLLLFGSLEGIDVVDENAVQNVAKELMYEGTGKKPEDAPTEAMKFQFVDDDDDDVVDDIEDDQELDLPVKQIVEQTVTKNSPPEKVEATTKETKVAVEREQEKEVDIVRPSLTLVSNNSSAQPKREELPSIQPKTLPSEHEWVAFLREVVQLNQTRNMELLFEHAHKPVSPHLRNLLELTSGQRQIPGHLHHLFGKTDQRELKRAIRFYVQETLLNSSADYYRRLGLPSRVDEASVKIHYQHLFKLFQPDSNIDAEQWDRRHTQRINQAYATLRDPHKRIAYDQFLEDLQLQANQDVSQQSAFVDSVDVEEPDSNMEVATTDPQIEYDSGESKKSGSGLIWALLVFLMAAGGGGFWFYTTTMSDNSSASHIASLADSDKPIRSGGINREAITEESNTQETAPAHVEEPVYEAKSSVSESIRQTQPEISVEKESVGKKTPVLTDQSTRLSTSNKRRDEAVTPTPVVVEKVTPKKVTKEPVERKPPKTTKESQVAESGLDTEAKTKVAQISSNGDQKKNIVETKAPIPNKKELNEMLQKFSLVYETGDIDAFMEMFVDEAYTNDQENKEGIRKDYQALFANTIMRTIDITNVSWLIKDDKARGKGDFVVTVKQKGNTQQRVVGTISIGFVKKQDKLFLTDMLHTYNLNN